MEPRLAVCLSCGRLSPDDNETALTVVIRHAPLSGSGADRDVARVLAQATGTDSEWMARYLRARPSRLRLPGSEALSRRLQEWLADNGFDSEVLDLPPEETSVAGYLRWLFTSKLGLVPYGVGAGLWALCAGQGAHGTGMVVLGATVAWALFDRARFLRCVTLRPDVLAEALGMVPRAITGAAAAVLKDARSPELRAALAAVLTEQARLLGVLDRVWREHRRLHAPMRAALEDLAGHALRLAGRAAAIELAGEPDDPELPRRLAGFRAMGSVEVERQLRALGAATQERQVRRQWLHQVQAVLMLRLETIADALRSLRQRAVAATVGDAPLGDAAADRLVAELAGEIEVAVSALVEIESTVDEHLPVVVGDPVG